MKVTGLVENSASTEFAELQAEFGLSLLMDAGATGAFARNALRLGLDPDRVDLAVREADGIVIFTGCSHRGILNMIRTVVQRFPETPVKGVIGGFHLMGLPPFGIGGPDRRSIAALGRELAAYPQARYCTGHCTGHRAFQVLKSVLAERIEPLTTGTVLTL